MGYVNTEQTIAIIEATGRVVEKAKPKPEPVNYWWALTLVIIPVLLTWWLKRKK